MINQNHDAINYCENCDVEYIAPASAPCPLCPALPAAGSIQRRLRPSQPHRAVQSAHGHGRLGDRATDQRRCRRRRLVPNKIPARVCGPRRNMANHYAALLQREGYDRERHRAAIQARREARNAHREKREQIQREVAVVKARRSQHGNACS